MTGKLLPNNRENEIIDGQITELGQDSLAMSSGQAFNSETFLSGEIPNEARFLREMELERQKHIWKVGDTEQMSGIVKFNPNATPSANQDDVQNKSNVRVYDGRATTLEPVYPTYCMDAQGQVLTATQEIIACTVNDLVSYRGYKPVEKLGENSRVALYGLRRQGINALNGGQYYKMLSDKRLLDIIVPLKEELLRTTSDKYFEMDYFNLIREFGVKRIWKDILIDPVGRNLPKIFSRIKNASENHLTYENMLQILVLTGKLTTEEANLIVNDHFYQF